MGVNDREDSRRDEKRANKRERAKEARGRRASASGKVDWVGYDWTCVVALTEALVAVGGAVRLGATRDGGAWALGIYLGDDYATEYIRGAEDFEAAIGEIVAAWLPGGEGAWWERVIQLRQAASQPR